MIDNLRGLAQDESGSAMVEYVLVLVLVSMISFATLSEIGLLLQNFFTDSSAGFLDVAKLAQ